jgi:hypothetical protein
MVKYGQFKNGLRSCSRLSVAIFHKASNLVNLRDLILNIVLVYFSSVRDDQGWVKKEFFFIFITIIYILLIKAIIN